MHSVASERVASGSNAQAVKSVHPTQEVNSHKRGWESGRPGRVAGFHNGAPHTGEVFTRTVVVDGTGVVVAGILVGAPDARLVIARPVIFGRRRVEVARPDICAPELIRLSGEVIRPSQYSQEYEHNAVRARFWALSNLVNSNRTV